jgi:hypothetical protein
MCVLCGDAAHYIQHSPFSNYHDLERKPLSDCKYRYRPWDAVQRAISVWGLEKSMQALGFNDNHREVG